MSKKNKEKRVISKISKRSATGELTPEEIQTLALADYQKRSKECNEQIENVLKAHQIGIRVQLKYLPTGITPVVELVDMKQVPTGKPVDPSN